MKIKLTSLQWCLLIGEFFIVFLIIHKAVTSLSLSFRDYQNKFQSSKQSINIQTDLTNIIDRLKDLNNDLDQLKRTFPVINDQATILVQIQALAEKNDITRIESIKPLEDVATIDFIRKRFEMTISGEYTAVMRFISQLEHHNPPFVIRRLNMRPISPDIEVLVTAKIEMERLVFQNF